MHPDDDPISAAIFDFVEQWHCDVENGDRYDVEHYVARFPGQAVAIRAEYSNLSATLDSDAVPATAPVEGRRIGPYLLVRELGRGGQGAVYLATDTRMVREVALKVLPDVAFSAGERLRRFRREADAVAGLSHPGLCDVLDADFSGEPPYIAMRYVPGVSLSAAVSGDALPDRKEVLRRVGLLVRVARALHVAHEAGVIHRDIKPGNIQVTPDDDPVVLDFGLAREADDVSLTEPGAVFGTLHYMAPEQLADEPPAIDRRVDVHALGVTLYELVTGERPFAAQTREVLALKIRRDPPRDARTVNPAVPGDLSVVIAKALEKDPKRRYATALALAADLQRVCNYEPIEARPAGVLIKLRRWAQRHPILSTSTILVTLLLTAGLVISLVLLDQVRGERERYRSTFYATHARKLVEQDPTFALLTAIEAARIDRSYLANTALYEALDACRELRRVSRVSQQADVVVGVDGTQVALVATDGTCEIEDLSGAGRPLVRLPEIVRCVQFDPGGEHLVAGTDGGEVIVFSSRTGERERELPGREVPVVGVTFTASGTQIAVCDASGVVVLLDVATGREILRFGETGRPLGGFRIADDARQCVTLDASGVLRSYSLEAGQARVEVEWGHEEAIRQCEVSRDGELVAFSTETRFVVAAAHTGNVSFDVQPPTRIGAIAFDPEGRRVVGCHQGGFAIFSAVDGQLLAEQSAHRRQMILDVAFSEDGALLATGAADSSMCVFSAGDGALLHEFRGLAAHVRQVHFASDGAVLIGVGDSQHVVVYGLLDRPGMRTLRGHSAGVRGAQFSPDATRILSGSDDKTARIWDLAGQVLHTLPHDAAVGRVSWSPDGGRCVTVTTSGIARVWDLSSPGEPIVLETERAVEAWFAAGGAVLTLSVSNGVRQWDRRGAEMPREVELGGSMGRGERPTRGTITADGTRFALGYERPHVEVLNLGDGGTVREFGFESKHEKVPSPSVFSIQFSPSGRYLAVGGQDTHVRLYAADTLALLGSFPCWTPGSLTFDAAESHLLVGAIFNPKVAFLEIVPGGLESVASIFDHRERVSTVEFSPDGSLFLSASYDGTVRLYNAADARPYGMLAGHEHAVTSASFSPDGRMILTASLDGSLRLWPVDPFALAQEWIARDMSVVERDRLQRALDGG